MSEILTMAWSFANSALPVLGVCLAFRVAGTVLLYAGREIFPKTPDLDLSFVSFDE